MRCKFCNIPISSIEAFVKHLAEEHDKEVAQWYAYEYIADPDCDPCDLDLLT